MAARLRHLRVAVGGSSAALVPVEEIVLEAVDKYVRAVTARQASWSARKSLRERAAPRPRPLLAGAIAAPSASTPWSAPNATKPGHVSLCASGPERGVSRMCTHGPLGKGL